MLGFSFSMDSLNLIRDTAGHITQRCPLRGCKVAFGKEIRYLQHCVDIANVDTSVFADPYK